ncbi:unnamed protein product [Peronospora destructor]|uniref:Cytochrome b5 heme-binding domain-containing protein n=1 Tax=Peronospora destructor TaxID=86335 RepID=A0AAV0VCL3_9STRA|nr:unnamed protein product [Peronospora destructor]
MEQLAPISSSSKVHLDEATRVIETHGKVCSNPVLFPALKPTLEKAVALSSLMRTFDLEELEELGLVTASQALQQQEKSIVVDYEDSDGDRVRLRDQAPACVLSACGPLVDSAAAAGSSSERLAHRRSRCGSLEMLSLKGKSVVLEQNIEDVFPSMSDTDTDEKMRCSKVHKLCMCEVKLHRSLESCWLVCSGQVYDVTGLVTVHPGGIRSILRKVGGPDCAQDMKFHTKNARKMMEKCFIGKLERCGDDVDCASEANCSVM